MRRVVALRALVARAGEGAFLLRVLAEHNLGRLAMRTDEATQRALKDGGARSSAVQLLNQQGIQKFTNAFLMMVLLGNLALLIKDAHSQVSSQATAVINT